MSAIDKELSTYVDIATSIASQGSRFRESHSVCLVNPETLATEWTARIKHWLKDHPTSRAVLMDDKSPSGVTFGAFFLQRPVIAMHLWNVTQELYELDRVICAPNNTEETVIRWESIDVFEYLRDREVEQEWADSLLAWNQMVGVLRTGPWITEVVSLVGSLTEAWEAFQRSFAENFKRFRPPMALLEEVEIVVKRRLAMLNNLIRADTESAMRGNSKEQVDSNSGKPPTLPMEQDFRPKAFSRTDSIDAFKDYVTFVKMASKRGEATLGAILVHIVVLIVLYQVLWRVDTA